MLLRLLYLTILLSYCGSHDSTSVGVSAFTLPAQHPHHGQQLTTASHYRNIRRMDQRSAVSGSVSVSSSVSSSNRISHGHARGRNLTRSGALFSSNTQRSFLRQNAGPNCYSRKVRSLAHAMSLLVYKTLQRARQKILLASAVFLTSTFLCLGPVHHPSHVLPIRPPVAHASTSLSIPSSGSSSISSSSMKSNKNMDSMIQDYVQRHMFREEMYDPVESTYREIIHDAKTSSTTTTTKPYSKILASTIASVLGKKQVAQSQSTRVSTEGQTIKFLLKLVDSIEEKTGLSKAWIVPGLFLVGGGIPVVMILAALMSFSYSQKAMTERMAIERYGESVLEAEEIVVREEEEEEEDDEDDEEDEDDEDDDEDDEEDNGNNGKGKGKGKPKK